LGVAVKRIALLVAFAAVMIAAPPARYWYRNGFALPVARLTPGAIRTADTSVYCHQRTRDVRHTSAALKDTVYRAFGWTTAAHPAGEVDHKVPLELGGADVRANLWFQPAPDHLAKDSVENWARREVCAGRMSGVWAQQIFMRDWTHAWLHMHGRSA